MAKIPTALLALCLSTACLAAPPNAGKQDSKATPQDKPQAGDLVLPHDENGKHCEWACLRWEKQCTVDPRGVYKCVRVCGQFGQQCE